MLCDHYSMGSKNVRNGEQRKKEKNQIQMGITKPATAWYNKHCLLDSVRLFSETIHQMMYLGAVWLVERKENISTKLLSLIFQSVCRYQAGLSVSLLSSSWGRGEQHIMLSLSDVLSSCAYIEAGGNGGTWS